jgi:hypothetical protein
MRAAPHLLDQTQILTMHSFVLQAVQAEREILPGAVLREVQAVLQKIPSVKIRCQEPTVEMVLRVSILAPAQVPVAMVLMAVALAVLR